jgi:membrane protein
MGAAIAFYSIFALAPLLIVATAMAGTVFGLDQVRTEFAAQVAGLIGENAARGLQGLLAASWKPGAGVIASVIGVATLLAGATGVLVELRNALDVILHLREGRRSTVAAFVRARLAALGLVLGFGFLLIMSLILSALVAAFAAWLPRGSELSGLLRALDVVASMLVLSLAFAAIIRWLPSEPPPWKLVLVSAVCSALLFTIGKTVIGLYLARAAFVNAYGAAGSLAVILVWIYFTSQLMLLAVAFGRQLEGLPSRDDRPATHPDGRLRDEGASFNP